MRFVSRMNSGIRRQCEHDRLQAYEIVKNSRRVKTFLKDKEKKIKNFRVEKIHAEIFAFR